MMEKREKVIVGAAAGIAAISALAYLTARAAEAAPPPPPPPPKKVTLMIKGAIGGTIYYGGEAIRAGETKTFTLNELDPVEITQVADLGYTFKYWMVDGSVALNDTLAFNIDRDMTVSAVFEAVPPPPPPPPPGEPKFSIVDFEVASPLASGYHQEALVATYTIKNAGDVEGDVRAAILLDSGLLSQKDYHLSPGESASDSVTIAVPSGIDTADIRLVLYNLTLSRVDDERVFRWTRKPPEIVGPRFTISSLELGDTTVTEEGISLVPVFYVITNTGDRAGECRVRLAVKVAAGVRYYQREYEIPPSQQIADTIELTLPPDMDETYMTLFAINLTTGRTDDEATVRWFKVPPPVPPPPDISDIDRILASLVLRAPIARVYIEPTDAQFDVIAKFLDPHAHSILGGGYDNTFFRNYITTSVKVNGIELTDKMHLGMVDIVRVDSYVMSKQTGTVLYSETKILVPNFERGTVSVQDRSEYRLAEPPVFEKDHIGAFRYIEWHPGIEWDPRIVRGRILTHIKAWLSVGHREEKLWTILSYSDNVYISDSVIARDHKAGTRKYVIRMDLPEIEPLTPAALTLAGRDSGELFKLELVF